MGEVTFRQLREEYDLSQVAVRLGQQVKPFSRDKFITHCPFHADSHPSLVLDIQGEYRGTFICSACKAKGDVATLVRHFYPELKGPEQVKRWLDGQNQKEPWKPVEKLPELPKLNGDLTTFAAAAQSNFGPRAMAYLARRRVLKVARKLGWGSTEGKFDPSLLPETWIEKDGKSVVIQQRKFLDRIIIPYFTLQDYSCKFVNARVLDDAKVTKYNPKFLKAKDTGSPPYLLDVALLGESLFLTEAEFDAASILSAGNFPVAALPGVGCLHDDQGSLFEGKHVIVLFDNDVSKIPGKKPPAELARDRMDEIIGPYALSVTHARLPSDFKDVNEMLVKAGVERLSGFLQHQMDSLPKKRVYTKRKLSF